MKTHKRHQKKTPRVPRQGYPKPETLVRLGDKKNVLDFLMGEYNEIRELQALDAPVLVAYLSGDNAVCREAVIDAFRNQAAMHALDALWTLICREEIVYESELANHQRAYDRIGEDADKLATQYMRDLERIRVRNHDPAAHPREVLHAIARAESAAGVRVRVEIGQRWRTLRWRGGHAPGAVLEVDIVNTENATANLVNADGDDAVPMKLDHDGSPASDHWELVDRVIDRIPKSVRDAFKKSFEPGVKVEVGQLWRLTRPHAPSDPGRVVEKKRWSDGHLYAIVEFDIGRSEMRLDEAGACADPNWHFVAAEEAGPVQVESAADVEKGHVARDERWRSASPKVEVGQRWRFMNEDARVLTVERIEPRNRAGAHDFAVFFGEVNHAMLLDDAGYPHAPNEWQFVGGPKVLVGQTWRRRSSGALLTVTAIHKCEDGVENAYGDSGKQPSSLGLHVEMTKDGFCLRYDVWELVSGTRDWWPAVQEATAAGIKVKKGQRWRLRECGRIGIVMTEPRPGSLWCVDVDLESGGRGVMTVNRDGLCDKPNVWEYVGEAEGVKVHVGQRWERLLRIRGKAAPVGVVTEILQLNNLVAMIQRDDEISMMMPLSADGTCRDKDAWKLLSAQ